MKNILIVDDSATARMFVRRCLEIVGFADAEYVEASDGQSALDSMQQMTPDLIVTDLFMHPMTGTELLERVKANPLWQKIPVMVITSAKNEAKEKELISLGALTVLAKPVSPPALMDALQKIPD